MNIQGPIMKYGMKIIPFGIFLILFLTASPIWAASPLIGKTASDFALKSDKGTNHRLSEYRGDVVMINFWATWCGPCREEMPILDDLYKQYKALGFVVLGINIDDKRSAADKMLKKLNVSYPILFDTDKRVSEQYPVTGMPTTIIMDRDGIVRHVHYGYKAGYIDTYQAEVRALLAERGK